MSEAQKKTYMEIAKQTISRYSASGRNGVSHSAPLGSLRETLPYMGHFDTGWLNTSASGLLRLQTGGSHMQIVYQHEPGIYPIIWGDSEGDEYAKTLQLAQPWRVVIADFINNGSSFLGARTFYSPEPFYPWTQLYHANIPNLNCLGYKGVSVGWLCLYRNDADVPESVQGKINYAVHRASGMEAYNNSNMPETDGTRFYQAKYMRDRGDIANDRRFLWDPEAWEAKTLREGFEWTLDPDLWIPVKVHPEAVQRYHYEGPESMDLLLEHATDLPYSAYYTDEDLVKPFQDTSQIDLERSLGLWVTSRSSSTKPWDPEEQGAVAISVPGVESGTLLYSRPTPQPRLDERGMCVCECNKVVPYSDTAWVASSCVVACSSCIKIDPTEMTVSYDPNPSSVDEE